MTQRICGHTDVSCVDMKLYFGACFIMSFGGTHCIKRIKRSTNAIKIEILVDLVTKTNSMVPRNTVVWDHCANLILINRQYIWLNSIKKIELISSSALSHYSQQCLFFVNWTFRNKLQWNLNRHQYISIQENAFANVVCKMASISSRPR